MDLFIPKNYRSVLDIYQTEQAIKLVKDFFQMNLASELRLRRITAPLFVKKGQGINDDLNGIERPVSFPIKEMDDAQAEIVQSLAKWKRMALADLKMPAGYGIYTDMNAIRPDEVLSNIHSLYVDQWDWERIITPEERNLEYLKKTVRQIYSVMVRTENLVQDYYPEIVPCLPGEITFFHSEELAAMYPDIPPRERETKVVREYGAVFIIGIGGVMPNGEVHDGRAPDYDDWSTGTEDGNKGLNGDIVIWNSILERAFEISSMGIRVNRESLMEQLRIRSAEDRMKLYWHQLLLSGKLPLTIGGGIGQSRLCMYYLRKAHIGEIQSSIWPDHMVSLCNKAGIQLL